MFIEVVEFYNHGCRIINLLGIRHPFVSRIENKSLPVLIEPVVNLGLSVEGITEVGRSGGGNPELWLISAENVVNQLLILSLVIFLDDAEVSEGGA